MQNANMACIEISDVSDGEIFDEDLEEISSPEEEYFEKVANRVDMQLNEIQQRKIELELQNTLAHGRFEASCE
jgi:hypothetical protein